MQPGAGLTREDVFGFVNLIFYNLTYILENASADKKVKREEANKFTFISEQFYENRNHGRSSTRRTGTRGAIVF